MTAFFASDYTGIMPGPLDADETISQLFGLIARQTGCDFSLYKPSTLARRIDQARHRVGSPDGKAYLEYLEDHPEEVIKLYRHLLIGVTSFFRNPRTFDRLKEEWEIWWPERSPGPVRVWVAACSTGEEAYSLAILLQEFLDQKAPLHEFHLFATDVDVQAVEAARRGWYRDSSLTSLSAERRNRWFERDGRGWRVRKSLRDHLTFAVHNLLSDPPFGQLDLVSCRNLFIYLDPEAQNSLASSFAFALKRHGLLLLGTSESADPRRLWFEPLDKKSKLYQRRTNDRPRPPYSSVPGNREKKDPMLTPNPPLRDLTVKELVLDLIARDYAVPSVLVDGGGTIQFVWGDTSPVFRRRAGRATDQVVENVVDSLQVALANALGSATSERRTAVVEGLRLAEPDGRPVRLTVRPVENPVLGSPHYLVVFQILEVSTVVPGSAARDPAQDRRVEELERELNDTRMYLRNLVLKLETANEELAAGNEEAQSMNEELQSSNEELESSREELQATNDELETLTSAHTRRIEDLAQLNNDLANLIASARLGMIFLDRQLNLERFTPEAAAVLGLQESELGRPFPGMAGHILGRDLEGLLTRVLKDLKPEERELTTGRRVLLLRVLPYRTTEDRIEGVVLTLNDLTALRDAEAQGRRSEQKFQALFDNNPNAVILADLAEDFGEGRTDFRIVAANPAFGNLFAVKTQDTLGRLASEVIPFVGYRWIEAMEQVASSGTPRTFTILSEMLGRHLKIGLYSAGESRVALLMEDISETMKVQEKLRQSEALFRSTLTSIDDLVFVLDTEGKYLDFFQGRRRNDLLIVPENFLGKRFDELPLPTEAIEAHKGAFEAIKAGASVADWAYSLPYPDGPRWFSSRLSPRYNAEGDFDGAVSVSRDFTDRVLAEEALREREAQLRAVFEASPMGLFLAREGRLIRANTALSRMYGDAVLEGWSLERLATKDPEPRGLRPDGTSFPIRVELVEVEPQLQVGVAQDLSERQRMEKSVFNAQRLESVGILAGGIAHDFNNLLGGMFGFIQLARKATADETPAARHLDRAFSAFARAQDLTRQLLTFSKGGEPVKKILHLQGPLEESAKFILSGANLRLETNFAPDLWPCEVDRQQLGQVIDNLGLNARQAMPGGGEVRLTAVNVPEGSSLPAALEPGPYVLVKFADDGPGILSDVLPRIFDPFFSTKKDGSGLGLATAFSILRKHGGLIEAESSPGHGATFKLWFPALFNNDPETPGSRPHRILILDDEELILDTLTESLREWGYDVFGVTDGPSAVEAFRQARRDGRRFNFFLTDLTLPGEKGGLAVVDQLRKIDPGLKAAASSGYSDDPVMADPAAWGLEGFLPKPYTRDQLTAFMAKVFPITKPL